MKELDRNQAELVMQRMADLVILTAPSRFEKPREIIDFMHIALDMMIAKELGNPGTLGK